MIFTRISRGAQRTAMIVRLQLNKLQGSLQTRRSIFSNITRSVSVSTFLVARLATFPVSQVQAAAITPDTEAEPPSTTRISSATFEAIRIQSEGILLLENKITEPVIGKSVAQIKEEEIAAQAELDRQAAKKAEDERIAKEKAAQAAKQAKLVSNVEIAYAAISKNDIISKMHDAAVARFGEDQWPALYNIVMRESGFNPLSKNRSSGACGLFQAYPCSKLPSLEVDSQINWGINYIAHRYGTPSNAWSYWLLHHSY